MIPRLAKTHVRSLLQQFPAVGLLGPRQVGKTTLAHQVAEEISIPHVYLDLERPSDLAKMREPELYLQSQSGRLVILDEIQRAPDLFNILRSIIDERRRQGEKFSQFLLLGSASLELLQQSAESLAGRIVYKELSGLSVSEIIEYSHSSSISALWLKGGFPDSFLADSDTASFQWRHAFIRTYLERDIPQLGPRVPAETLNRFWTMLAHNQGSLLNISNLASAMSLSNTTLHRYLDLLVDLLLVRRIQPWFGNVKKRLIKSPKIYIRDSGLTHALLGIRTENDLLSHPVAGNSWEGFIIENILMSLPSHVNTSFYRTVAGAEIDLIIEIGDQYRIAIEIKRSLNPKVSAGFHLGCEDIKATHRYVVYSGQERFHLSKDLEAISISNLLDEISVFNN
jgi:predicted AAA+ superfamily ATPase